METFIKLMKNKLVAFLFGALVALIGCVGVMGEGSVAGFAAAFSLVCIAVKELVNNQMCFNNFDWKVPVLSIVGAVIIILVWTILI